MSEANGTVTKALAVLQGAVKNGALTFVTKEDCMAVTPLYKPEISVINLKLPKDKNDQSADVYNISGKFMPKREIVDRIGEATGLVFIHDGCKTWTETYEDDIAGKRTVYISEQQAKKRMSDGSWRTSSVQAYEFDPVMRAMLDYNVTELNAQTKQTKDKWGKKTLAQTILEYTKVARQRAETGARLRVIRELTNMPTAFSAEDAAKPLVFGRFAQNTDYILQTREGRAMASAQALGVDVASLFGGRKISPEENEIAPAVETEQRTALPSSSMTEYEEAVCEDSSVEENAESLAEQAAQPSGENEFEALTLTLEQLTTTYKDILDTTLKTGQNPYRLAMEELDANNFNASEISRQEMIKRVKDFLRARRIEV